MECVIGKPPLCGDGCGKHVLWNKHNRKWNRFLCGHTGGAKKGQNHWSLPEAFGEKIRQRMIIDNPMKNPDVAKRSGKARQGRTKENDESVRRMSETKKGKSNGPHTKETNRKIGEGNKGKRKGKTYEELFGPIKAAEWKVNLHKATWGNDDFVSRQMVSRGVAPNRLELQFMDLLNKIYPDEYKFVGDGQVIIAGKCPDFINVNGKKKIIELFGDYWHKGEDPQDRIDIFKPFGWDTLVIWERELKNIKRVIFKINKFHNTGMDIGADQME